MSAVGSRVWNALNDAGIGDWPTLAEKVKGPDGAKWLMDLPGLGEASVLYVKELLVVEGLTVKDYPWFDEFWKE